MPTVIVNEFSIACTDPDGNPGEVSLVGKISLVQNLGVTYDVAPSSTPAFTLTSNPNMARISGAAITNTLPVTVNAEPIDGTKFKLTFSGDGAPGGFLKTGAYRLKAGSVVIGAFNVCFGAREESVMVRRVIIDAAQVAAFNGTFSGDLPYDPEFDVNLDGQVKVEDSSAMTANAGTLWIAK